MSTSTWNPPTLKEQPEKINVNEYLNLATDQSAEIIRLRLDVENALFMLRAYRKDLEQAQAEKQQLMDELAEYKQREQRHAEWMEEKEAQ